MNTTTITANDPRPSDCSDTAGALDLDIVVTLPDGEMIEGEVTLLPSQCHAGYVSWGEPSHWVSGDLLSALSGAAESAAAASSKYDADVELESLLHKVCCEAALVADEYRPNR